MGTKGRSRRPPAPRGPLGQGPLSLETMAGCDGPPRSQITQERNGALSLAGQWQPGYRRAQCPGGVLSRDHRFSHQGETKQRRAGVLWVAVHVRHTVGPKNIAAPTCPGSDTATIRKTHRRPKKHSSPEVPRIGHSCYTRSENVGVLFADISSAVPADGWLHLNAGLSYQGGSKANRRTTASSALARARRRRTARQHFPHGCPCLSPRLPPGRTSGKSSACATASRAAPRHRTRPPE